MNRIFYRIFSISILLVMVLGSLVYLVNAQEGPSTVKTGVLDDAYSQVQAQRAVEIGSQQIYLIRLRDLPLASYRGGIAGFEATNPGARGDRKLNPRNPASLAYRDYLLAKQAEFITKAEGLLERALEVKYHYYAANNGLAVYLTAEEAERVAGLPEVKFIQLNYERQLLTDVSPGFISAPGIWDGSNTGGLPGTKGEGIIVGVIDSGINPSNPSFADVGEDSYNHTNPWGSGVYVGVCNASNPLYDPTFPCNDKLIGAWGYTSVNGGDPRDSNDAGHGTHTASTAAGNFTTAQLNGNTTSATRQISGIAPHANIVAYAACCTADALSAAIDQIVLDGVDVVNYSIGSTAPSDPWNDFDTVGYLAARDAGIFVATSAGNAGPNRSTVGSPGDAPWILTVAASTHDRKIVNRLENMSGGSTTPPADIVGAGFTAGYGPAKIVYAGSFGDGLCLNPFPAGTWTNGEIVICDRGQIARVDKGANVQAGGAGGLILANTAAEGDWVVGDDHYIPAVHITYNDGLVLKAWVASGSNHMGTISGYVFEQNADWGDVMTDFSSRGPDRALMDIVKPDIAAPGKDILAASGTNDPNPPVWAFLDGTSMASPHMAGAGALMKALHPTWTPAEIQSALMTTAWQGMTDYDLVSPADPFDMGSGRVDLSVAAKAGLVLNETRANYEAANPSTGGNPSTLNQASMGSGACYQTCSWTRTVRSTQSSSVTWTVDPYATEGLDLTVSPSSFTIPAGGTQTITVTADVRMAPSNTWVFGEIRLTPSNPNIPAAHLPVAAYANSTTNLPVFDKTANVDLVQQGSNILYTITLTHKSMTSKSYSISDAVPANATYVNGSATGGLVYNAGANNLTWSGSFPAGDFVISEENKSGYISMGDLGVPPATAPSNLDTGCLLVTLNDLVYFGTTYTQGVWSVNGTLKAGLDIFCASNTNAQVPSTATPNGVLAAWWDDLDFTSGGAWYFVGVTWDGKPHTVFSWENVPIKGTSDTASFQIWFEEGVDNIWFAYPPGGVPSGSPSATVGAENSGGTDGYTYYYNGSGTVPNGSADLVLGPVPIVSTFTFQVSANAIPEVLNQAQVTQSTNTYTAYAYSKVYIQNTWLGNTTSWGATGNWSRGSLPGQSDWVIIPTSPSGGNMPVLGGDAAVYNLEIQPGASLNLAAYKLTVQGSLVNNGTIRQTKDVPAGQTTRFLNLANISNAQDKYFALEITPSSGAMGSTTVEIRGNAQCTSTDPTDTVNRCFNIIPTTPQTARLRFYYLDSEKDGQNPDNVQVWHWGTGWSSAGTVAGRGVENPGYHWVEVSGVNTYSPFTLSEKVGGPTVVALQDIQAGSAGRWMFYGLLVLFVLALAAGGLLLYVRRA